MPHNNFFLIRNLRPVMDCIKKLTNPNFDAPVLCPYWIRKYNLTSKAKLVKVHTHSSGKNITSKSTEIFCRNGYKFFNVGPRMTVRVRISLFRYLPTTFFYIRLPLKVKLVISRPKLNRSKLDSNSLLVMIIIHIGDYHFGTYIQCICLLIIWRHW